MQLKLVVEGKVDEAKAEPSVLPDHLGATETI
jgi:hypothetical protein